MLLSLYRGATMAAGPLVRMYLAGRLRRGKEDAERFRERLGEAGAPRPPGPLVWLHGASVGEALSALPLIERLRRERPGLQVLLTTGTVTSARMIAGRLPEGARHQYVPVDRPAYVARFLDHWRPDLGLWLESEFWPNLMTATRARGIPMVLVNGRISESSFRGWKRTPETAAALTSCFELCLGQTEEDAERLRALGAMQSRCVGNLKFAAPPLPADPAAVAAFADTIGARPRWVAASTHPGEEALAGRVHRALEERLPGLLSVIVPRHADRGAEIAAGLARDGLRVARRAAGEPVTAATQVYLADTMGDLGIFFRVAEVAFVGKSLVPHGGQNPLEPARLDCAVLFGPHMANFADMAQRMAAAGGARVVADETALTEALAALLGDPALRQSAAEAARAFAEGEAEVLDRIVAALGPQLDGVAPRQVDHARA